MSFYPIQRRAAPPPEEGRGSVDYEILESGLKKWNVRGDEIPRAIRMSLSPSTSSLETRRVVCSHTTPANKTGELSPEQRFSQTLSGQIERNERRLKLRLDLRRFCQTHIETASALQNQVVGSGQDPLDHYSSHAVWTIRNMGNCTASPPAVIPLSERKEPESLEIPDWRSNRSFRNNAINYLAELIHTKLQSPPSRELQSPPSRKLQGSPHSRGRQEIADSIAAKLGEAARSEYLNRVKQELETQLASILETDGLDSPLTRDFAGGSNAEMAGWIDREVMKKATRFVKLHTLPFASSAEDEIGSLRKALISIYRDATVKFRTELVTELFQNTCFSIFQDASPPYDPALLADALWQINFIPPLLRAAHQDPMINLTNCMDARMLEVLRERNLDESIGAIVPALVQNLKNKLQSDIPK